MKPPPFAYAAPATLEEAVGLLTEHAEAEPRVLAGGQSLIPLMNFRLAKPGYLVDLRNVAGLSGIRREGDVLVIGAMTRMAEVGRYPRDPGRGVLHRAVQHGAGGGRDPDRDPAAGLARRARVHRILPGARQLRRGGRGRAGGAGRQR